MGNVTRSGKSNITSPSGNSLAVFVDGETGYLKLKDVRGNIQSILDFIPALNPAVGTFSNTQTQTVLENTESPVYYDTIDASLNISLVDNSKLLVDVNGYYDLQFSAQFKSTSGGVQDATIWLKKNGINVDNTSTEITLKNNEYDIMALNFVVFLSQGEFLELFWSATNSLVTMYALPERINPIRPAVPSIITTINRVG